MPRLNLYQQTIKDADATREEIDRAIAFYAKRGITLGFGYKSGRPYGWCLQGGKSVNGGAVCGILWVSLEEAIDTPLKTLTRFQRYLRES